MSIFGNYGDMHSWEQVKQIELFHWSILFGLVACGAIYHGLKYDNGITKGFGLTVTVDQRMAESRAGLVFAR
jgi:hypothetical protein